MELVCLVCLAGAAARSTRTEFPRTLDLLTFAVPCG